MEGDTMTLQTVRRPRHEAFPAPLRTEFVPQSPRPHWWSWRQRPRVRLLEPFAYNDLAFGLLTVHEGFVCDGASVPPALWPLIGDPFGDLLPAAILHDWGYATRALPREWIDVVFCRALRDCGVGLLRARSIYRGVRVFGALYWREGRGHA
jgi:hypothetical protein